MTFHHLRNSLFHLIRNINQPICLNQSEYLQASQLSNERNEIFDALKGVAIIFMIIGHSEIGPLYPFIYSFHMPLFFFVTGYFFKIRPVREELVLSVKRLIVPYIFTAFCICIIAVFWDLLINSWENFSFTQARIVRYALGFRGLSAPNWMVGHVGLLWFILAMFWARCIAVFFLKRINSLAILGAIFLFLGIVGIFLGENIFIPFCIPQGLSAICFIYVGFLIKKFNLINLNTAKNFIPFLLILWFYTWMQGGLSMARSWYSTGYIFGILGSAGAFFTLYVFVVSAYNKSSVFWKAIHFAGRYSLIMYVIHSIDYDICNWSAIAQYIHIPYECATFFQISSRLVIVYVCTSLILKIRPLRAGVFQISNA
ncbi:acyltransferase family protein [uncultured Fibrobacter sp.]|uniref:acyltransferase family protein n=1 Tax=uncultured Fibrobacter sp. TaxID=261512 RepID=UPI0025FF3D18|nr:acyltransferase family protein [uncultured Fibrobacter sp.]